MAKDIIFPIDFIKQYVSILELSHSYYFSEIVKSILSVRFFLTGNRKIVKLNSKDFSISDRNDRKLLVFILFLMILP